MSDPVLIYHGPFVLKSDYDDLHRQLDEVQAEISVMQQDLNRIGNALGVCAKPYSGHEAVERDFIPRIAALAAATHEIERLEDQNKRLVLAMFSAIDVVKANVGDFDNWPVVLKDAFSAAIIDPSSPSDAELASLASATGQDAKYETHLQVVRFIETAERFRRVIDGDVASPSSTEP